MVDGLPLYVGPGQIQIIRQTQYCHAGPIDLHDKPCGGHWFESNRPSHSFMMGRSSSGKSIHMLTSCRALNAKDRAKSWYRSPSRRLKRLGLHSFSRGGNCGQEEK